MILEGSWDFTAAGLSRIDGCCVLFDILRTIRINQLDFKSSRQSISLADHLGGLIACPALCDNFRYLNLKISCAKLALPCKIWH